MPLASTTSPSTSDIITKASPLLLPLLVFHCSPAAHIPLTAKKVVSHWQRPSCMSRRPAQQDHEPLCLV
ncbi:hypothetical protein C8034_v004144 [Colletotrichum sidae]|uniref:Uncharacterized protein n=1 Tax=Colletotrichum sidae TaxID=1347389 RepID=A0A4R8T8P3_9PEZI|nr:hypothetical protein C8034_v004144 [Colletotrichum sidae]